MKLPHDQITCQPMVSVQDGVRKNLFSFALRGLKKPQVRTELAIRWTGSISDVVDELPGVVQRLVSHQRNNGEEWNLDVRELVNIALASFRDTVLEMEASMQRETEIINKWFHRHIELPVETVRYCVVTTNDHDAPHQCPECDGTATQSNGDPCHRCEGTGTVTYTKKTTPLPPGPTSENIQPTPGA